jgi:hypothetical protein
MSAVRTKLDRLTRRAGVAAADPDDCGCVVVYLPDNGRGDQPLPVHCLRCGQPVLVIEGGAAPARQHRQFLGTTFGASRCMVPVGNRIDFRNIL